MNAGDQAMTGGWRVHGLDYYGPCWPLGGGRFLFSRRLLGDWGDAALSCSRGDCRLDVLMPDAGADWVLGVALPDNVEAQGLRIASPEEPVRVFVSGWDPGGATRADLPERTEDQHWVAFSGEGAIASLWSGQGGRWLALDPAELLQRCRPGSPALCPLPRYRPEGVPGLVEAILRHMDEDPVPARRGRRCWKIRHGSAAMWLCYSEERALLSAEVHLVRLGAETRRRELMAFLLQENLRLSGYGFSLQEDLVVIALVLPARFLREEVTAALLRGLLERADRYDNELVGRFGAEWLRP